MENIVNGFDFGKLPLKVEFSGKVVDLEWPHFLWTVRIEHKNGWWTVPYKCGLGHTEKKPGAFPMPNPPYRKGTVAYEQWAAQNTRPKKPKNSDIIYSLLSDMRAGELSFTEFCSDFGYSDDSIKAFNIYRTCAEYGVHMRKTFSREQIAEMEKALEDY